MKRLGVALLLVVALASTADAFLPSSIETTIRGWFNSASRLVLLKFYERGQPAASTTGNCIWYMDSTSHALKVSCNGGTYSFIAGAGTTVAGCAFVSGALTCPAFDSPADPVNGGCVTLKEGSNNGVNTSQDCAPPALSTNRINLRNTDGTHKSSDVETPTANELGRLARYNLSTGIMESKPASNPAFLPDSTAGVFGAVATTITEVQAGNNQTRCVVFTALDTVVNATKIAMEVVTANTSCGVCIYPDLDAGGLIAPLTAGVPSTTFDCSTIGGKTKTGLDAYTLQEGVKYRLCWTASNTTTALRGGATRVTGIANALTTSAGTGNAGSTGVCNATTGALTPATVTPPIVAVGS